MDKKIKIAIIGSRGYPYVYSGYETLVKELSERLVKKGHNVRVYCHRSLFKKKPKYVNGIELVYTPSIETKILSQFINSFFSFIHVIFSSYDIIFVVNAANGPFGLITKVLGKRTCINVDGLEWLRPKWKGLASFYYRLSSKLSSKLFDHIITDSYSMQKIYRHKFSKDSTVIAYGHTMLRQTKISILNNLGISKNKYFLVVGRLIPDNNSDLIVEGFLMAKTDKKLVVVGDVPYKDSYAELLKMKGNDKIIFTGYIKNQNDLSSLYQNCYCYIHGHEFGGTNPTMINALFINCPVLALNTKFNKEMLKGKKSLFFEKNKKSVTKTISVFEENILEIISQNKTYKFPEIYDWDKIVKSYINVFKKINS